MIHYNINIKLLSRLALLALAGATLSQPAFALKKWVDEHGTVHYGDRIPPRYLKQEHQTLNEQGVVVQTKKATKTSEELAKEEQDRQKEAEFKKQQLIEQRKQALRDRVLLDTFTTEKDLEIARDARIEAIDSQISLAKTMIQNDEKNLNEVKTRISQIESSGRQAPENLHKKVTSVSRQLENNYSFIEDKTNERDKILQTFDEDVKRFRELKSRKKR